MERLKQYGLASAAKKTGKRSLRFCSAVRILVPVTESKEKTTMTTKTLAVAPSALTVVVRLCGRNRVRVAQSVRTDDQGRLWATVAGCGRVRERLVLAVTAG